MLILLWCAALAPLARVAASDVRVLEAFQTDEVLQVNLLREALDRHTFALQFGNYPHLFFNLALLPLRALAPFHEVTDRDVAVTFRLICIASGAAIMALTFWWTRRAYGRVPAWFALGAMALNPLILLRSVYGHPDLPQLFFVVLALFYAASYADRPARRDLLLGSAASGLAFATKYGGGAVLGLIWLLAIRQSPPRSAVWPARVFRLIVACVGVAAATAFVWLDLARVTALLSDDGRLDIPEPEQVIAITRWTAGMVGAIAIAAAAWPGGWASLDRSPRLRGAGQALAESTVAFIAAFAIASPFSFERLAVVKGLVYHVVVEGLKTQVVTTRWHGFVIDNLGYALPIMAATCGAWVLVDLVRGRSRSGTDIVLLAWTILYGVILVLPAHLVESHYLLPVIPPLIMLAARCLGDALQLLAVRAHGLGRSAAPAMVGALALGLLLPWVPRFSADRRRELTRERNSNALRVGEWLACRVPPTARIAYDHISYVPAAFERASATWAGSLAWLREIDPDVVIVNHLTSDLSRANVEAGDYYRCVEGGACGFNLVHTRGEIAVYARMDRLPPGVLGSTSRCD